MFYCQYSVVTTYTTIMVVKVNFAPGHEIWCAMAAARSYNNTVFAESELSSKVALYITEQCLSMKKNQISGSIFYVR
jgi:hypothetical protein